MVLEGERGAGTTEEPSSARFPSRTPNNVLLLSLTSEAALFSPSFFAGPILHSTEHTSESLLVLVVSPLFDPYNPKPVQVLARDDDMHGLHNTDAFEFVQAFLSFAYIQAMAVAKKEDRWLLDVNVVLANSRRATTLLEEKRQSIDTVFVAGDPSKLPFQLSPSLSVIPLPCPSPAGPMDSHGKPVESEAFPPTHRVVAVGGTFDHLHAGHKILLSMAAFIAGEKIIVGVTDDSLLTKKSNILLLEPLPERIRRVKTFLTLFKPELAQEIVPISDVYGPTATDPDVQALVVSRETKAGADAIHKKRIEKSFPPLRTYVIDVVSADLSSLLPEDVDAQVLKDGKMSSSGIRAWIAEKQAQAGAGGGAGAEGGTNGA